ncbi:MAG: AraC family transcriptional regulator [Bacteroidetes bacterium]|uniref:AraC family ligand binding domain-containing protein n=1 Tax=Chitinophaga sp. LS1 TaxID=3051176 RepID=UPI001D83AD97|nr:AraC family ligand binding domain-containing protein [Chitinophaga sp. LS1]MBP1649964.1 AraC family transcriptional regulator [Bacteroidota bacterium]WPV66217.1 AraC family ligand binding domain-containing protein [Chitinophaga sp. LS1]
MKKDIERHVFNSLKEQYLFQDLPTDLIDDQTDFTIHNIRDIHPVLPYTSIVYRVNFFSFVFVKSGTGRYTTDEQIYTTQPGTIYFTNPGHFKSFEWQELDEVYLKLFSIKKPLPYSRRFLSDFRMGCILLLSVPEERWFNTQ